MKSRKILFLYMLTLLTSISVLTSFKNHYKNSNMDNKPVDKIDFKKFQGKWYSLTSIPTALDKKWRKTIENYTLKHNRFDVFTTYYKIGNPEEQSIKSKLFFYADKPDGDMKAQFLWPFKISYFVLELPDDYSYVVIGHQDKKYLFIMSRKPTIDKSLMAAIIERCRKSGYDVDKLVSQEHN
ncbi:lipocalin family protein [Pedobacter jejuensis]|nr:lipocalin family protein [Pedobacter jejuensis]